MDKQSKFQKNIVISFIIVLVFVVGIIGGYFLGTMINGINEDDYFLRSVIKEYGIKYNVSTSFLRKLFPDQIVYLDDGQVTFTDYDPDLVLNTYDWNDLVITDDKYDYISANISQVIQGIDVSKFQGDIDWTAIAADGIEFAFLRVGYRGYSEGMVYGDDYFHQNAQNATDNGVNIGVYFFSQALTTDEAIEEANFVLNEIKDYDISYPIVFDMEDISGVVERTSNMTKAEITAITIAFCDKIAEAGYIPMIYGNSHWFFSKLDLEQVTQYDKWYAQYSSEPYYPYEFTIWQYSNNGIVNGTNGAIDRNISFIDYAK